MTVQPLQSPKPPSAEQIAYWYFRLNGFLLTDNFYVHPRREGGARTDADLLAVRFPHRAERLFDDSNDIMVDDAELLFLTRDRIDVLMVEVKEGKCQINGPWTESSHQNIQRVLSAIGCVQHNQINNVARILYKEGYFDDGDMVRVRLVAFGRAVDEMITAKYPQVSQITVEGALRFIYHRLQRYWRQKRDTQHWNAVGHLLKNQVRRYHRDEDEFVAWALGRLFPANR